MLLLLLLLLGVRAPPAASIRVVGSRVPIAARLLLLLLGRPVAWWLGRCTCGTAAARPRLCRPAQVVVQAGFAKRWAPLFPQAGWDLRALHVAAAVAVAVAVAWGTLLRRVTEGSVKDRGIPRCAWLLLLLLLPRLPRALPCAAAAADDTVAAAVAIAPAAVTAAGWLRGTGCRLSVVKQSFTFAPPATFALCRLKALLT